MILPKGSVASNPVTPKGRAPAEFGIGNAPKDVIRGPGIANYHVTVIKNILFNHTNFQGVDTTARFDAQNRQVSGTFGQYTSSLDARRIVLGPKFYF